MKRLKQVLDIKYKKITKHDWDDILLLTGDEGISKSNLGLHIIVDWIKRKYKDVKAEHIKFIGLDREQFLKALKDAKQYEVIIYDESGDITNKRSMSEFNVEIAQAYQVIRGDNLFTVLILPSVFDLDGFFTKRRARGLIYVYSRGRFAYWNRSRLRKLIAINQFRYIKSVWAVKPLFYDTFPKYKGVLKKPYDKKKQKKTKDVRKELYAKLIQGKKTTLNDSVKLITTLAEKLGTKKAAEISGKSQRTIQRIAQKHKATATDDI